jgi:hypothetical protein
VLQRVIPSRGAVHSERSERAGDERQVDDRDKYEQPRSDDQRSLAFSRLLNTLPPSSKLVVARRKKEAVLSKFASSETIKAPSGRAHLSCSCVPDSSRGRLVSSATCSEPGRD